MGGGAVGGTNSASGGGGVAELVTALCVPVGVQPLLVGGGCRGYKLC